MTFELFSWCQKRFQYNFFSFFFLLLLFCNLDPLLGSGSEDEEDDEPTHHIRGGLSALVGLGGNGSDSIGALGPSDMSVQSTNSDSKMTQDDSDQVSYPFHSH